jgi:hypothetical protein
VFLGADDPPCTRVAGGCWALVELGVRNRRAFAVAGSDAGESLVDKRWLRCGASGAGIREAVVGNFDKSLRIVAANGTGGTAAALGLGVWTLVHAFAGADVERLRWR